MKFSALEKIHDGESLGDQEGSDLLPYHNYFARISDIDTVQRMIELAPEKADKNGINKV